MTRPASGPSTAPSLRTGRTDDGLVVAFRPLAAGAVPAEAWRRLARESVVDNLFYEAEFTDAAADAFGEGIGLLVVGDRPPEAPGLHLLALWPCRIVRRWGLPLPVLMGWTHGFSIFGAPLLDRDDPERALRALLAAPALLGLPRRLMMPYLPLDGPFAALMDATLRAQGSRRVDYWAHRRGWLDLAAMDGPARAGYLAAQLSPRRTRQLARLARRLGAAGAVEHRTLRAPDALAAGFEDYLALEAAGWKGRAGTAIGQRPAEADFLRRMIAAYGAAGRVRIDQLRRGGTSLAASLAVTSGATLWYLKIAHDEGEARNSPGAHLVERVTRALLSDPGLACADSCAPPDFTLIETFWSGRRRLAHGLVEAEGGDPLFPLAVGLERLRAGLSRARAAARAHLRSAARP